MPENLFDLQLRAMRRDRAFRNGPELFLHERAFEDCLERIALVNRRFRSALMIGCPDPAWPNRLKLHSEVVDVLEPGGLFAAEAGASWVVEDEWPGSPGHDLCTAIGTLDTVNALPQVLFAIRQSLTTDALFIGAMAGGDTLPELRNAMRAADQVSGAAVAHVHPRIEASALASLLSAGGFVNVVVDVDRIRASYESLDRLVGDLRAMSATNVLQARSRFPLSRAARDAAVQAFAASGANGRTTESFEILHFAAWTPSEVQQG
jgi:hypothetical protein